MLSIRLLTKKQTIGQQKDWRDLISLSIYHLDRWNRIKEMNFTFNYVIIGKKCLHFSQLVSVNFHA
jgi:hypothetical protein